MDELAGGVASEAIVFSSEALSEAIGASNPRLIHPAACIKLFNSASSFMISLYAELLGRALLLVLLADTVGCDVVAGMCAAADIWLFCCEYLRELRDEPLLRRDEDDWKKLGTELGVGSMNCEELFAGEKFGSLASELPAVVALPTGIVGVVGSRTESEARVLACDVIKPWDRG